MPLVVNLQARLTSALQQEWTIHSALIQGGKKSNLDDGKVFSPWMLVQKQFRKKNPSGKGANNSGSKKEGANLVKDDTGSRFHILSDPHADFHINDKPSMPRVRNALGGKNPQKSKPGSFKLAGQVASKKKKVTVQRNPPKHDEKTGKETVGDSDALVISIDTEILKKSCNNVDEKSILETMRFLQKQQPAIGLGNVLHEDLFLQPSHGPDIKTLHHVARMKNTLSPGESSNRPPDLGQANGETGCNDMHNENMVSDLPILEPVDQREVEIQRDDFGSSMASPNPEFK